MSDIPVRLRPRALVPAGWPADVAPNQIITAAHINAIRSSVYAWPGDVDGQGHTLRNVHIEGSTGVLVDPTTTAGDLLARDAGALGRFPIGAAGQVLTVDTAQPAKLRWATPAVAPVASVFGRFNAVVAQAGDYTAAMVTGAVVDSLTTKGDIFARTAAATGRLPAGSDGQVLRADAAQPFGLRWSGESVPNVFGRTGQIAAQAGDYTAAQVTNAVSVLGSYPDAPWLPSLSWSKLIGVPATFPASAHTHDAAAIVSGVLSTARLGTGVASNQVYLRGDGTWAAAGSGGGGGVISVFGRAGTVVAQGGDYTAAMVTGAVVDPTVIKGDLMVRNDINVMARLPLGASGQVLQADTSLSVGMKWTTLGAAVQTPWVTNVDAAGYQLANVSRLGVAMTPGYPLDVTGDINYSGTLRKNGAPVSFGGSQTPWTSDINAASFLLNNAGAIGIGGAATSARFTIQGGTLATTAGAGMIAHLAQAFTPNDDKFSTTLWRISATASWDSAVWRLARIVDTSDIANIDFGASQITMGTGGTQRLGLTSTGLGLGILAPTANLEISDFVASDTPGQAHKIRHSWNGVPIFGWRIGGGNATYHLDVLSSGWYAGMTFNRTNGNCGIITPNPLAPLHVAADVARQLYLTIAGDPTNKQMRLGFDVNLNAAVVETSWFGGGGSLLLNPTGGYVGISTGAAMPGSLLQIGSYQSGTGEATQRGAIQIQDASGSASLNACTGYEIKCSPSGLGYGWKIGTTNTIDFAIGVRANSATWTEVMRLTSAGKVGVGTGAVGLQGRLTVSGGNQVGSAINTAGALDGVLELTDTGGSAGSGGMLLFSANSQNWKFASIRGYAVSGGSNSLGHIVFSTRRLDTDATLTEQMRITIGSVGILQPNPAHALDVVGNVNCTGAFLVNGAALAFAPTVHTHDASAIVSGVLASARLGAGTANSSVFLRGDGQWAAPAGGAGGGVTTGSGNVAGVTRIVGTPYQNGAKPTFVTVSVSASTGNGAYADTGAASSGGFNAGTKCGQVTNAGNSAAYLTLSFWVLPNLWYQVSIINAAGLTHWYEWN